VQIVALTFAYTWLFNNTTGSVLFAMFLHATMNATSQLMGQLLPPDANELLARFIPVVAVLIVIAATRGCLSFRVDSHAAAAPKLVR
jgi:membrane protease YdiL (CAAX protease family)